MQIWCSTGIMSCLGASSHYILLEFALGTEAPDCGLGFRVTALPFLESRAEGPESRGSEIHRLARCFRVSGPKPPFRPLSFGAAEPLLPCCLGATCLRGLPRSYPLLVGFFPYRLDCLLGGFDRRAERSHSPRLKSLSPQDPKPPRKPQPQKP